MSLNDIGNNNNNENRSNMNNTRSSLSANVVTVDNATFAHRYFFVVAFVPYTRLFICPQEQLLYSAVYALRFIFPLFSTKNLFTI